MLVHDDDDSDDKKKGGRDGDSKRGGRDGDSKRAVPMRNKYVQMIMNMAAKFDNQAEFILD